MRIYGAVSQGEGTFVAVTREHGMFRCPTPRHSEASCTPFSPGLTDLLAASQPYHATVVAEGILVIATRRSGVVMLDRTGRLLRILNEASGLRDENVRYSYVDRQGGLWLGLNNGLARVEISSPLSYWDKTSGLLGSVTDVARHQGHLYAATSLGVYILASAIEGAAPRFLPHPGVSTPCWSLLSTPQGLLAGCSGGLYNLDRQQRIWPAGTRHVYTMHRTSQDPTLLYLGLTDGLARIRLRAGQWTDVERIASVREPAVRTIIEDAQARLWMEMPHRGPPGRGSRGRSVRPRPDLERPGPHQVWCRRRPARRSEPHGYSGRPGNSTCSTSTATWKTWSRRRCRRSRC